MSGFKAVLFIVFAAMSMPAQAFNFMKDMDGKVRSLDEYTGQGKWTVVMMWAHDCHVCNKEAHAYTDFHNRHKDKDAIIVGISMDGKKHLQQAKAFVSRHKLSFDNLWGEPQVIAQDFEQLTGVEWFGTPTFLVFSPSGELMAQQVGAVPTSIIEDFMAKNADK